jgi:hypothetical protein
VSSRPESGGNKLARKRLGGPVVGAFTTSTGGGNGGMVSDGTSLWAILDNSVLRIRPSDMTLIGEANVLPGHQIAFDGTSIWVNGFNAGNLEVFKVTRLP